MVKRTIPVSAPPRAWQRMLSGRRLDLLDPSPLDVEIEDIANSTVAGALSSLPYAFHTTSRYEPIVVPPATTGSGTSTPVGLAFSAPLATLVPSSFFQA